MARTTILLVEGVRREPTSLEPALAKVGYHVIVTHTCAAAVNWAGAHRADVIVFDGASLPEKEACRRLREATTNTPIIHTRKNGTKRDKTAGADVYLMQPFTSRKVLNRIRALLPVNEWEEQIVRAGNLTFYVDKGSVLVSGRNETQLTPRLALLLEEFLRHPNQVRTRLQLMQNVWETDYIGDTRTLEVHVSWLRKAIEVDPSAPERLMTVRGVGYILRIGP